MEKFLAIFSLFRKGQAVANAEAWKTGQVSANVVGGLIVAAVSTASVFGVNIPVDAETANSIAVGVLAVVNVVLTYITSDKIGLAAKAE